jgi:hypothetical protein
MKYAGRPFREKRQEVLKRRMQQGKYPITLQQKAALLYAVTGSFELASEKSEVPIKVIKEWSRYPWFTIILEEFRSENLSKLDAAFTEVIDKAIIEIKERLEKGDPYVTKSGKIVRKPVSIRDLAIVQAINIDKRQLLRGEPTSRSSIAKESPEELLQSLADKFTKIIDKKKQNQNTTIIEGEISDAEFVESPSQSNASSSDQLSVFQESGSSSKSSS